MSFGSYKILARLQNNINFRQIEVIQIYFYHLLGNVREMSIIINIPLHQLRLREVRYLPPVDALSLGVTTPDYK